MGREIANGEENVDTMTFFWHFNSCEIAIRAFYLDKSKVPVNYERNAMQFIENEREFFFLHACTRSMNTKLV